VRTTSENAVEAARLLRAHGVGEVLDRVLRPDALGTTHRALKELPGLAVDRVTGRA
jgi:hypothetical protein